MKKYIITLVIILTMMCSTVFANSTIYSNNLLISVKMTQPKSITVKVYEEKQMVNGSLSSININTLANSKTSMNKSSFTPVLITTENFSSTKNLSFYTRQINDVNPGLYLIEIDTKDANGKVIYSNNSYFAVKEKAAAVEPNIFETPQSGTLQFLQGLLKTIFGN